MQFFINEAIQILKQGGLVAMPTETVYGLGADAKNPVALEKIFHAKQRPMDHPLIVHLADVSQLGEWVSHVSPMAQKLADAFWPGPLTLILPKAVQVLDIVTGGQKTVGVRVPRHPVAQALLRGFDGGVAAPSANRFGRISPTTAEAVREELGDAVDLILEGGECEVGLESTIVDVSGEGVRILRPGMITAEQIEGVLGIRLQEGMEKVPRVSGSMESHYAPVTRMRLMGVEELMACLGALSSEELPVAVMVRTMQGGERDGVVCVKMADDAGGYAHDLYQTLRGLDQRGFKKILVEDVPRDGEWAAVRDRLVKASFGG